MNESENANVGLNVVLSFISLSLGFLFWNISPEPFNFIFIGLSIFAVLSIIFNHFKHKNSPYIDFTAKFIKESASKYDDYFLSDDSLSGIAIDEKDNKLYLLERKNIKSDYSIIEFEFHKILESGIVEDEQVLIKTSKGGLIGGSLLGSALFGGVGAIVGGMSASKTSTEQVKKVTLSIVIDDLKLPIRKVVFFISPHPVNKNNTKYQINFQKCNLWHKRISVIINRN